MIKKTFIKKTQPLANVYYLGSIKIVHQKTEYNKIYPVNGKVLEYSISKKKKLIYRELDFDEFQHTFLVKICVYYKHPKMSRQLCTFIYSWISLSCH